ncbi:MAG: TonB-dependent receptor [Gammaproteobacteria bacterium]
MKQHTDIPAQGLGTALEALARQRQLQLVYLSDSVDTQQTSGAAGELTADEALTKLLSGTGLTYRYLDDRTVTVKPIPTAPPPAASNAGDPAPLEEVVITGSHLRGAIAASPVVQVDQAYIERSGLADTGDLLRSLPQNWGGGQNPGTMGAPGATGNPSFASSANLRGLGADATLTLVNGHRLSYDGYQNNVDVSIIPLAALQRIDVLTDGASAIYGSDAVAGVVNFILRKDYDGAEVTARFGQSTRGDAFEEQYSALAGKSWSTGNLVFAYERANDDGLNTPQRPDITDSSQGSSSLLPATRRNSAFLSGNQSINDSLSLFLQALYTSRSASGGAGYAPFDAVLVSRTDVSQGGVTGGADVTLPGGWAQSTSVDFSTSVDKTHSRQLALSSGAVVNDSRGYYKNRTLAFETTANGPLLALPTGEVSAALGAGYRRENFQNISSTVRSADRGISYAYGELSAPLVTPDSQRTGLEKLEINLALRYERYDEFGGTTNPKFGFAWYPLESLKMRGTWGSSFKAPSLTNQHSPQQLSLYPATTLNAPASATGPVLLHSGSNPDLGPETARSWTVGFDYTPAQLAGLKLAATYFDIDYTDRIVRPFPSFVNVFNNPYNTPFIVYSPSEALQESVRSMVPSMSNFTNAPYDPAAVYALVENQLQNAASQKVSGVDLDASYTTALGRGTISLFGAASWLRLEQELLPAAPYQTLDGTIFNPPAERYRAGVTWQVQGLSITGIVNYIGESTNNVVTPSVTLSSWTTVDTTLSYDFAAAGAAWTGLKISMSAQNLFDRDPPRISSGSTNPGGIGFDGTNASALGRFVSIALSKAW